MFRVSSSGNRLIRAVILMGLMGCVGPEGTGDQPGAADPVAPPGVVPEHVASFVSRFGPPNPAAAGKAGDCVLGEITLTAASMGRGTPAAGQVLRISQNTALFSLLGTTYGGDGVMTFALPDLRGLAPKHMTYMICTEGLFPTKL